MSVPFYYCMYYAYCCYYQYLILKSGCFFKEVLVVPHTKYCGLALQESEKAEVKPEML